MAGFALGASIGAVGTARFSNWLTFRSYKDYKGYAHLARSLTRQSLVPLKSNVQAFKANFYDIDHVIPVKCGWVMKIPPAVIASISNLQALPASINRSIGSKGC